MSRVRMPAEEAAARALLTARPALVRLARDLLAPVVKADPNAEASRVLLGIVENRDVNVLEHATRFVSPVPGSVAVALAQALVRLGAPAQARRVAESLPHEPLVAGDDAVNRSAVALVAQGVWPASDLSADAAIEWAAIGGARRAPSPRSPAVDPRHAYLAAALDPLSDPSTSTSLGQRLRRQDPVVASADAIAALESGALRGDDAAKLVAVDPADPLVVSVALRVAEALGDHETQARVASMARAMGLPRIKDATLKE